MKDNRRPNYGLDAPLAVRNLLIVAALGIISLITRLLGVWSRQDLIAVIARPLIGGRPELRRDGLVDDLRQQDRQDARARHIISTGSSGGVTSACWMWGVGWDCFSSARPSALKTGRAVGIDLWQAEDLSGNNASRHAQATR